MPEEPFDERLGRQQVALGPLGAGHQRAERRLGRNRHPDLEQVGLGGRKAEELDQARPGAAFRTVQAPPQGLIELLIGTSLPSQLVLRPVCAAVGGEPGEAVLFNQEIIHGNVPNKTKQTRVSIDFRLVVKGGKIRRKLVGGYFDLLDKDILKRGES